MMSILFVLVVVAISFRRVQKTHLKKPRDYLIFGLSLAGFIGLGFASTLYRDAMSKAYFREQFHLPPGAEFAEMPRSRYGPPSRAVVEFSDADWHRYVTGLHDPERATPFLFGFSADPHRHARIARWQGLPPALTVETAPKHILEIPRIYDFAWDYPVKNGLILCIVYVAETVDGARSCHDTTKGDPLRSFLLGVLDFDEKRLYLRYRGPRDSWV